MNAIIPNVLFTRKTSLPELRDAVHRFRREHMADPDIVVIPLGSLCELIGSKDYTDRIANVMPDVMSPTMAVQMLAKCLFVGRVMVVKSWSSEP